MGRVRNSRGLSVNESVRLSFANSQYISGGICGSFFGYFVSVLYLKLHGHKMREMSVPTKFADLMTINRH